MNEKRPITFDFRMDKSSWAMIAFIFATMMYYILQGAGGGLPTSGYFQAVLFSLLTTFALIAMLCIPVLIFCYFIKMIPDIDYSVRAAFVVTIIGIITELF